MAATQQFIEDAIKGGCNSKWTLDYEACHHIPKAFEGFLIADTHRILLDPLAWQAVGKTRGWVADGYNMNFQDESCFTPRGSWKHNLIRFTGQIADGKTIEEALSLIQD